MQRKMVRVVGIFLIVMLYGCAHLDFSDGGLTYYDPKPYFFVSTTKDCVITATVVMIPDQKKMVKFVSGYGTADLSIGLSNGMIISAGQKTDTKIPETLTAITGMATASAAIAKVRAADVGTPKKEVICIPTAKLYPIVNGIPSDKSINDFDVKMEDTKDVK